MKYFWGINYFFWGVLLILGVSNVIEMTELQITRVVIWVVASTLGWCIAEVGENVIKEINKKK